jgi:DNA-binding MarR family transcriptional regulator
MNQETTSAPRDRAQVALAATEALEALADLAARELERHAAAFGLSDAKLEVLEVLGCCEDRRACLYALGDELRVTRPNVTKLVDGLEREGLVERLPHPRDRRMVQAHITGAGADVAERALPGRRERMERLWSRLSDEELAELARLLRAALAPEREAVASADATG